ncbi:MAG TPA: RsmG family class I SAM-dependent methyltransferase [Acidimicrobiales bacterium]|nr:RsmG family class I SAM-dependent methyltransferase [Acidimicrobiales bacterium]
MTGPAPGGQLDKELAANLELLLTDARQLGFLGPGPVSDQVARSLAFGAAALSAEECVPNGGPDGVSVDLGSGGGVPGLVLALLWPESQWLLVDSNQRRATWLQGAVSALGIENRVDVVCDRAERVARSSWRHQAGAVTARGFGPPGPTAECAAPLLRLGGQLLVAEPPGAPSDRWPAKDLVKLGLSLDASGVIATPAGPVSISRLLAASKCSELYPRRVGVPFKRPLF